MRHSGEHDERSLYSSMELETAVRLKLNITVIVFRAGGYNMVAFQQDLIYGRTSGTDFGNPDLVKYAESFGCLGMRVNQPQELLPVLRKALDTAGMASGRHTDGLQQECRDWRTPDSQSLGLRGSA